MASKADVEAGRAFVRLFLKNDMASQLARGLKSAGAKLKSFGRGAMVAGAKVTAVGTALLAPLTMAVKSFAAQGDALDKMSQRTGMAASSLAELGFAAEQSGSDIGAVENAVLKMNRRLGRLTVGQGSATEVSAVEELGLSVKQLDSMNPEERFLALADAMAKYGDDAAAAGLAQRAFGTGVDRILPLLKLGRKGIEGLRAEARDLAIVPSQEEVQNAAKVTDAINRVKRAVKAMFFNVGAGLAKPALQFLGVLKRIAVSAGKFAKNKGALLATVAAIGAVLVVGGTALTAFGIALWGAGFALSALGTAVGVLLSPIGLVTAAVVGGAVAWLKYSESGKRAWASLKAAVMPIIETLKTAFGGVQDAMMSGDWELAGKIAMAGLKLAFLQGLSAIQEAFPKTFGTVLRVFGKIGDGIVAVWNKVTGFLTDQWNGWGKKTLDTVMEVAGMIPQIWQQAVEGMANWMLKTSAKGGIMGKAMSKLLGVDMSEEQAKAELTERKARKVRLRNYEQTAKEIEVDITAGTATEGDRKVLEDMRAKIADLKAGGSGTAEGATVDVLADAREAVKQYTESMVANAGDLSGALGGEPGTGKVSELLDAFLTKLESGSGIADAAKELAALRKEAAKRKTEETKKESSKKEPPPPTSMPAVAPRGVALTATYSAAAARISGYQPGGGGPEEQMANGIDSVKESAKQMVTQLNKLGGFGQSLGRQLEQFLAGWKVP